MKGLALGTALLVLGVSLVAATLGAQLLRSPALQAPAALRAAASEAAVRTGTEAALLLAIAYRQTRFGQARSEQPDSLVPADIQSAVDLAALAPGGATATALRLAGGRRLGDWVSADPEQPGPGIGFLEIGADLWRGQAPRAPGGPRDPYRPLDAMLVAGHYLDQLRAAGLDPREALSSLAGPRFAGEVLELLTGAAGTGQPMSCSGYTLSQDYGPASFELEPPLFGYPHFHSGWDLVCPAGTPVVSVSPGLASVQVEAGGYGISVVVAAGDLYVRYAHLAQASVGSGKAVSAGQELGREGSTGNSTAAHLHLEVDRGCPLPRCSINPAYLLPNPAERHGH